MGLVERIQYRINHYQEICKLTYYTAKYCNKKNKIRIENINSDEQINIFFANTLNDMKEYLLEGFLFAEGLTKGKKKNFFTISRKRNLMLSPFCKAFGSKIIYAHSINIKNYIQAFQALRRIKKYVSNGAELLELEYRDILVGPSIYDTILFRTGDCTIKSLNSKKQWKIIFESILLTTVIDNLFKVKKPDCCIVMDEAYEPEIYRRLTQKYGGKIYWANIIIKSYRDINGDVTTYFDNAVKREISEEMEKETSCNCIQEALECLKKYYILGDVGAVKGRILTGDAVSNKITANKDQIIKNMGLNPNKKNVFIFAHCMTDGPHASVDLLFQDYYDWLWKTLEIAESVNDVNWIVKFHPDRHRRRGGEVQGTQEIIDRFRKSENIFFFPDEYSISSVSELANAIITCRGKVGEEMSCFGIPIITAGKASYSRWGTIHCFDSVEEYNNVLYNINNIEMLDQIERETACKIFCAHSRIFADIDINDIIGRLIQKTTMDRVNRKESGDMISIEFFKELMKCEKDQYVSSYHYQQGEKENKSWK